MPKNKNSGNDSDKLCACGCGNITKIGYYGQSNKFIYGHNWKKNDPIDQLCYFCNQKTILDKRGNEQWYDHIYGYLCYRCHKTVWYYKNKKIRKFKRILKQ